MAAPLRIAEPHLPNRPTSPSARRLLRLQVVLVVAGGLALASGIVIAVCGSGQASTPMPGVETACFGDQPVCLSNDARQPWLSFYKDNRQHLGDILWRGDIYGHVGCVATTNYILCPSDDPRVRGTVWQFEPLDLGARLLPRGLAVKPNAPLHPLVAAFSDQLRQERQEPNYWLGTPISDPICTTSASGPQDASTCEQWFTIGVLRWPNRPSATVADVYLADLGRRVSR